MNKKFLSAILFGALMVSSTGTFVSCKDYDDDIDNINKELSTLKGDLSALQAKVNEGKWITSLAPTTGGFTVTFSDNTSYTITNGQAGADAVKWEIGTDGFWYKNDVKTEYQAVGQAGEAGEDKGNYFTVENGVIKTNGQISSVGHNCTFIVSVYDKKDGYKLAEKELTVSSVEKIATTKTYTKSETHELTLESKDYRFKFDMNDVYNTLGMSSQTFWSAGYTREYYIWDAERSEYVQTSSSNGVISAGTAYENNESFLYVNVKNILTKDQLGKYKVVFKIGNTGAEVVYEVKVVYPEVTLIKDNDYWKDGYMINAGKLVGSNYVMSGDLRRGYKNEDVDLVFEKVAGETRTDFTLIKNVLTYTGDCNDKEGNRINISTIDPVDVMVFVLINGQKIDNGTKIQVKFADPLKNITLKKDAKFETTDKKSPADKLQLNSAINLVSIAGEKVIENGTMDATIAGYYNAQAAKFEVSEEDAAKGASVNATTGEFIWQNDGVALTANKTINVKVTVTYTWGVAVGTIPVTVKSNL